MGEVVSLKLETIAEGPRFDADEILEEAKGNPFHTMMIIGQLDDGEMYIVGNANAGETMILLESAKHFIIHDL